VEFYCNEREVIHEPMPDPEVITPHPPAAREVESPLSEDRVVDQPDTVEETSVNPELNEPSVEDIATQPIVNNSSPIDYSQSRFALPQHV
jgi:hypothetical protein